MSEMRRRLEELVKAYEGLLEIDDRQQLDEYGQGEHDELLAVVVSLKDILNEC